jgi:hypothetical protein
MHTRRSCSQSEASEPAAGRSPASPPAADSTAEHAGRSTPALIHFEGDWPYREHLWLRQRVQEVDRTLQSVRSARSSGRTPPGLLYDARWLAQRSSSPDGTVRYTLHRQGTSHVLVGESLGRIDEQLNRLPVLEQ